MLQYDSIEVYEGKYSLQHFKYKHTTISYRLVFAEVNAVLPWILDDGDQFILLEFNISDT